MLMKEKTCVVSFLTKNEGTWKFNTSAYSEHMNKKDEGKQGS